jgi:hypothetical protein
MMQISDVADAPVVITCGCDDRTIPYTGRMSSVFTARRTVCDVCHPRDSNVSTVRDQGRPDKHPQRLQPVIFGGGMPMLAHWPSCLCDRAGRNGTHLFRSGNAQDHRVFCANKDLVLTERRKSSASLFLTPLSVNRLKEGDGQ